MVQTTLKTSSPLVAKTYSDPRGFSKSWLKANIKHQYGVYININKSLPNYFRIGAGGTKGGKLINRLNSDNVCKTNLTTIMRPWVPIWIMQIENLPSSLPDRYTNCWMSVPSPYWFGFSPKPKEQICYKAFACEHLIFGSFAQEHYFADESILEFNPVCLKSSPSPALDLPEPNNTPVLTWPNVQTGRDIQTQNQILINSANSLIQQLEDILNL